MKIDQYLAKIWKKYHSSLFWPHGSQQLTLDTRIFISSLAYARWHYRFRAAAVRAAESSHFKEAPLWCFCAQAPLNIRSRDMDRWNLRLMLKISFASCTDLYLVILAQFALEMCLAAQNRQKCLNPYFSVQGHSRSLLSVPIESPCTTSY